MDRVRASAPLAFAPGSSHGDVDSAGSADSLVQIVVVNARPNDERVARLRRVHGVLDRLESAREGATIIGVAAGLGADIKGHGVSTTSEARVGGQALKSAPRRARPVCAPSLIHLHRRVSVRFGSESDVSLGDTRTHCQPIGAGAAPVPTPEIKLLTEIRNLLKVVGHLAPPQFRSRWKRDEAQRILQSWQTSSPSVRITTLRLSKTGKAKAALLPQTTAQQRASVPAI